MDFINLQNDLVSKISSEIDAKKKQILLDKLSLLGVELNLELEEKRRFKILFMESTQNEQTIYYNDGSIDGIRVVTFCMIDTFPSYDLDDERSISVVSELKYY